MDENHLSLGCQLKYANCLFGRRVNAFLRNAFRHVIIFSSRVQWFQFALFSRVLFQDISKDSKGLSELNEASNLHLFNAASSGLSEIIFIKYVKIEIERFQRRTHKMRRKSEENVNRNVTEAETTSSVIGNCAGDVSFLHCVAFQGTVTKAAVCLNLNGDSVLFSPWDSV